MLGELTTEMAAGRRLFIYGAGADGKRILAGCRQAGIAIAGFLDRSFMTQKELGGVSVFSPAAWAECSTVLVVLGSGKHLDAMYDELRKKGLGDEQIFTAAAMYRRGCQSDGLGNHDYEGAVRQFLAKRKGEIYLPSLDLVITERCTLRCRDCSNLMQYYAKPQDSEASVVLESFAALLALVEGIGEVRILGGEPLLQPDLLGLVLERYTAVEKVGRFSVVTNGTLPLPKELLPWLKSPKVRVSCSNYEIAAARIGEQQAAAAQEGIRYELIWDNEAWLDYGRLKHYPYPPHFFWQLFEGCASRRYCNTLFKGRFYLCPRAAHGENLGAIPKVPADSVDLRGGRHTANQKERLRQLLKRTDYIRACEYCDWLHGQAVPKALQARRPLPYERYEDMQ